MCCLGIDLLQNTNGFSENTEESLESSHLYVPASSIKISDSCI